MVRRANMVSGIEGKKKRVYSSKYALSSICICPKCGDIYRRIAWNNRGKRSNVWRCCTRVENGPEACNAPTVQETELQEATVKAINLLMRCSSSMKEILAENISTALADDNSGELEEINKTLKAKQKELVNWPMPIKITVHLLMRSTEFEILSSNYWWKRLRLKDSKVGLQSCKSSWMLLTRN